MTKPHPTEAAMRAARELRCAGATNLGVPYMAEIIDLECNLARLESALRCCVIAWSGDMADASLRALVLNPELQIQLHAVISAGHPLMVRDSLTFDETLRYILRPLSLSQCGGK